MELISLRVDYSGRLGDKRLAKRAALLSDTLLKSKTSSIRAATQDEASQKGAYRFLNNEKVSEQALTQALQQRTTTLCKGRDLLVLQDSTEISLDTHTARLQPQSGFGPIGNHTTVGFKVHAALVLDAQKLTLLGLCYYYQWNRDWESGNKFSRNYKRLPIEQKEAYRWIEAAHQSKELLRTARSITFIEDRAGDIYEQFATIPDANTNLIIRSKDNRNVNGNAKLYPTLAKAPKAGELTVDIAKDIRKDTKGRRALLAVRYCPVAIRCPDGKKGVSQEVKLWAVEAKEINAKVSTPIVWRLLSTKEITCFEEALFLIERYKCRWYIEQFFRLMKKKGFQLEDSQLESAWAIRKLSVLLAGVILRIMQMLLAYGKEQDQPIEDVYSKKEIKCMQQLLVQLQTSKARNPFATTSLRWATWIMARLGGWKGGRKERPPGVICLKNGLDNFNLIYQGWILAKNVS